MCRRIKCFGGSMHGKSISLDNGVTRFEAPVRLGRRYFTDLCTPEAITAKYLIPKMYATHTYRLRQWRHHGVTEWGAQVFRHITIALLEGTDLLLWEQTDLDQATSLQRWEWHKEPDFLTQFDQWWEYQLAVVGHKQPNVRYYA